MRWFKVAAIAVGVLMAFLMVSFIIGLIMEVAIAALAVAAIIFAVKAAFYRNQISRSRLHSELREPTYSGPPPRYNKRDVDDELARLRREMDG